MSEEKLVPELRFQEFEGEWEKTKLGNISKITMGQSPKSKWYNKKKIGLPLIQGNADIKNRKTNPKLYTEKITRTADIGDLILTVRAPVGEIAKSKHNVCIGRGVCSIKSDNSEFIYYNLLKNEKKWERYAQGSTFTAINSESINNFEIYIPIKYEQDKIGNFFFLIDKKIELQEELIENLEEQKKGLMQKIFNQEVRFKDENGENYPEWEKIKLESLGDFYNGLRGKNKDYFINGNKKYIQYLNIFQNTIIDNSFNEYDYVLIKEGENQNQVKYGDLLFTQSSETYDEIGMTAVYLSKKEVYLNSFSFGFRFNDTSNINFKYIAYLFESNPMRRKIIKEGQGSTRINLSSNRLKKINLLLPIKEEQNKIASLLSLVDKKGDLAKKELENYKEYKKGLMQRMFI